MFYKSIDLLSFPLLCLLHLLEVCESEVSISGHTCDFDGIWHGQSLAPPPQ